MMILIAVILMLLYAPIAGGSPAVYRAVFMFTVVQIGTLFQRKADSLNSLGVALLILTEMNPQILWNVGFQLSASATAGIIAYGKRSPLVFKNEAPQKAIGSNSVIKVIGNSSRGTELLFSDKPLWGYPFIRVLRKSLFQNVEFPVGIPNMEDSISLIDVLAVEARWIWVDLQIYGYRVREGSACRLITPEKVKAIIPCFTRMYEDARLKLGCPAPVARRLMKQYRESMCYYLYEIIHSASTSELKDIASLYKRHVEVVGIHTANIFLRLRMSISRFSGRRLFRLIDIIEWLWFGSRSRFKRLLTD